MSGPGHPIDVVTLEPFVEAVREGLVDAGWGLSGLQKTTSHEFDGRWAGESTRSAYLFFHRDDLPESVSIEAFLDENSDGLRGELSLVMEGPRLDRMGSVRSVLARVTQASGESPTGRFRPGVTLRLSAAAATGSSSPPSAQLRVKLRIPESAVRTGTLGVVTAASAMVVAFEALLERPEVAEFLPPIVE